MQTGASASLQSLNQRVPGSNPGAPTIDRPLGSGGAIWAVNHKERSERPPLRYFTATLYPGRIGVAVAEGVAGGETVEGEGFEFGDSVVTGE